MIHLKICKSVQSFDELLGVFSVCFSKKEMENFIQANLRIITQEMDLQKTLRIVLPLEVQAQFNMFFETEALYLK